MVLSSGKIRVCGEEDDGDLPWNSGYKIYGFIRTTVQESWSVKCLLRSSPLLGAEEEKTQLKLSGEKEERKPVSKFSKFAKVAFTITHTLNSQAQQGTHSEQRLKFSRLGFGKGSSESKRGRREGREDLGPLCSF